MTVDATEVKVVELLATWLEQRLYPDTYLMDPVPIRPSHLELGKIYTCDGFHVRFALRSFHHSGDQVTLHGDVV